MRKCVPIIEMCFIPFTFDIFGFLPLKTIDLLQRVQRLMISNVVSLRFINVIFKIMGFAIQKGVTSQLVCLFAFLFLYNLDSYILK